MTWPMAGENHAYATKTYCKKRRKDIVFWFLICKIFTLNLRKSHTSKIKRLTLKLSQIKKGVDFEEEGKKCRCRFFSFSRVTGLLMLSTFTVSVEMSYRHIMSPVTLHLDTNMQVTTELILSSFDWLPITVTWRHRRFPHGLSKIITQRGLNLTLCQDLIFRQTKITWFSNTLL